MPRVAGAEPAVGQNAVDGRQVGLSECDLGGAGGGCGCCVVTVGR